MVGGFEFVIIFSVFMHWFLHPLHSWALNQNEQGQLHAVLFYLVFNHGRILERRMGEIKLLIIIQ